MPKIRDCDRCLYNARDYHLVCAPHPSGPPGNTCPDFEVDRELAGKHFIDFLELQRQSVAPNYYNGQLIVQPRQRWTRDEQMELIDTHPMFTGCCPACGAEFERDYRALVH
jgi:hypothetical protein